MVTIKGGPPEPIELGAADDVLIAHSNSMPGQFHVAVKLQKPVHTKRFGSTEYVCSCRGFQNHRKCWHVAWLAGEDTNG